MDSVYPHLVANTETRLLAVTSAASNLLAELDELHAIARGHGIELSQFLYDRFRLHRANDLSITQASAAIDGLRSAAESLDVFQISGSHAADLFYEIERDICDSVQRRRCRALQASAARPSAMRRMPCAVLLPWLWNRNRRPIQG